MEVTEICYVLLDVFGLTCSGAAVEQAFCYSRGVLVMSCNVYATRVTRANEIGYAKRTTYFTHVGRPCGICYI